MEVIRIKKILARNWPIGICLHCVRTLSWFVPTMSTLTYVYVQVIKKSFFKFICLEKTNWFYASAGLHSYIIYRFCIHPIILKRNKASLQWSYMNDLYIIMKLSQISTLELRYTIGYRTLDKRLCQNHTLESVHDLKFNSKSKVQLSSNQSAP